jgi:hypothetical protein
MIRGRVADNGTVINGTGFTVTRTALGNYTINFTTAFATIPTVVAMITDQWGVIRETGTPTTTTSASITIANPGASANIDGGFSFIAIG